MAEHHNVPLPPHLKGASLYEPPEDFLTFAREYGVAYVVLVDDKDKCNRSIRADGWIFINVRGTFWDGLIIPPWNASTYAEAVILSYLHEIGHVALNHSRDNRIKSTPSGLIINTTQSLWVNTFDDKQEFDAWLFAFVAKHENPGEYDKLICAFQAWSLSHPFKDKDWEDTAELQFKKVMGKALDGYSFYVPSWVQERLRKYAPNIDFNFPK